MQSGFQSVACPLMALLLLVFFRRWTVTGPRHERSTLACLAGKLFRYTAVGGLTHYRMTREKRTAPSDSPSAGARG